LTAVILTRKRLPGSRPDFLFIQVSYAIASCALPGMVDAYMLGMELNLKESVCASLPAKCHEFCQTPLLGEFNV
jgi:hypothetical protein